MFSLSDCRSGVYTRACLASRNPPISNTEDSRNSPTTHTVIVEVSVSEADPAAGAKLQPNSFLCAEAALLATSRPSEGTQTTPIV
jgi:hypothetical protein